LHFFKECNPIYSNYKKTKFEIFKNNFFLILQLILVKSWISQVTSHFIFYFDYIHIKIESSDVQDKISSIYRSDKSQIIYLFSRKNKFCKTILNINIVSVFFIFISHILTVLQILFRSNFFYFRSSMALYQNILSKILLIYQIAEINKKLFE
jgi:hypothetical protein